LSADFLAASATSGDVPLNASAENEGAPEELFDFDEPDTDEEEDDHIGDERYYRKIDLETFIKEAKATPGDDGVLDDYIAEQEHLIDDGYRNVCWDILDSIGKTEDEIEDLLDPLDCMSHEGGEMKDPAPYKKFLASLAKEHPKLVSDRLNEFYALEEIRLEQQRTGRVVNRVVFKRLVEEIAQDFGDVDFEPEAMKALQTAAEGYLVELFEKSNQIVVHGDRDKLERKDMQLVRRILGERR